MRPFPKGEILVHNWLVFRIPWRFLVFVNKTVFVFSWFSTLWSSRCSMTADHSPCLDIWRLSSSNQNINWNILLHASPSGNLSEQIDGVVSIILLRGHQIKSCYIVTNLNLQHQSSQLPALAFHNTLKLL